MDIDKKIVEIENTAYGLDCEQAYDKMNKHRHWLIRQLKKCREWRQTQEQGVHEVVEHRTKEACKAAVRKCHTEFMSGHVSRFDAIQAIDSAEIE